MGTKLPSTLLTKYYKLNKIHSRVLNLKRDTFRHFGFMAIPQSMKI